MLNHGNPAWNEAFFERIERNGSLEETYFTCSYSSIGSDEEGGGGIFCICTEETHRVINDRRLRMLRELSIETAQAETVREACQIGAQVFTHNLQDIPFALDYLLDSTHQHAQLASTTNLGVA